MLHMPTPMLMGGEAVDPYGGADIVLDFAGIKNSGSPFYRVDGVVYGSPAAAGFSGSGAFNAAGYTATGTQHLTSALNVPGDFMTLSDFVLPSASGNKQLWIMPMGTYWQTYTVAGTVQTHPTTTNSTTTTRLAFGRSGGLAKASLNNAAVATGGSFAAPGAGPIFIGNTDGLTLPWGAAIRLFTLSKRTFTDPQTQGLGI